MPAGQTDQGETRSASDYTQCWGSLPPGPTSPTTQLSRLAPSVLWGSPPSASPYSGHQSESTGACSLDLALRRSSFPRP